MSVDVLRAMTYAIDILRDHNCDGTAHYLDMSRSAVADLIQAMNWIASVNACDYEYQEKARKALARIGETK